MPGVLTPSDISVIGPLARSAFDLETAVEVMAGPDEIQGRGYRLELPRLEKKPSELRVAVWRDDAIARVDDEVAERVDRVAGTLADLGAEVDFEARPAFSSEHSHLVYRSLLQATMSSRVAEEQFEKMVAGVQGMDPADQSEDATVRRASVARFRAWSADNEQRTHLRWAWHRFFEDFDVLLTPVMATAAFPHDHRPFGERSIIVNNKPESYFAQVFWSGLTGGAYLPSTVVPTGPNSDGLPIGVQIAGPEYGDLITIGIAQLLEREGFGFTPAPGYS